MTQIESIMQACGNGLLNERGEVEITTPPASQKRRQRGRFNPNTQAWRVSYWTDADEKVGECAPTGRTTVYYNSAVSKREAHQRINKLRRFKRTDGTSRVYNIYTDN